MARTKQEIIELIQAAIIANPTLASIYGFTNPSFNDEFSLSSVEAQLCDVVAITTKTLEDVFDKHLKDIQDLIATKTPGTLFWYKQQALLFQFGHALEWDATNMRYSYAMTDESSRIIKLCAVAQSGGFLTMKLAKLDSSGSPEKLTPLELNAFKLNYMERVKYAGVIINYISDDADLMKLSLKVYYDPSILAPDGSLLTDPSKYPVNDAVSEMLYLMPFNGKFNTTSLIDWLQQVPGVVNPLLIGCEARYGSNPYQPVVDYYMPYSGYIKIDPLFPLTINYIPYVD